MATTQHIDALVETSSLQNAYNQAAISKIKENIETLNYNYHKQTEPLKQLL